jgi:hypothetical protein
VHGSARAAAPEATAPAAASADRAAPLDGAGADAGSDGDADFSDQLREASERYQRALKSYDDRNFDAALVEFRRAYELAPTFRILYNLGVVSLELRDYASALSYFERYLSDGAGQISPEQRSEVDRKIRDLSTHIGHLTVAVNVPGAEISVDDRVVGTAPLPRPLRLNAGARRISARIAGRLPDSRVVEVAGRDSAHVELTLIDPRAAVRTAPADREPDAAAARPSRSVPWLPWAGTAVLAGAAVFSGFRALSAQDAYESKLGEAGTTRKELNDADSKALTWSLAADSFGIAALALGGYSLYLTLRPPLTPAERRLAKARAVRAARTSNEPRPRLELGLARGMATFRTEF